jgi:hypothetical protein
LPQKPTLSAGRTIGAPPAQAPSAPSATRKTHAATVGSAAPTEKARAENPALVRAQAATGQAGALASCQNIAGLRQG